MIVIYMFIFALILWAPTFLVCGLFEYQNLFIEGFFSGIGFFMGYGVYHYKKGKNRNGTD